jgi:hypothetical protein
MAVRLVEAMVLLPLVLMALPITAHMTPTLPTTLALIVTEMAVAPLAAMSIQL